MYLFVYFLALWLFLFVITTSVVISLALFAGFAGAVVPFIVIGLSERDEQRAEDATEYPARENTPGRANWYLKLRQIQFPRTQRDSHDHDLSSQ